MKIESAPLESVTPYARNPRKNADAVAKVAASIKEYGWRQPIVVDEERVIIAGHTRLMAAQRLGLDKVPVHIATGLTPQQVKAYRLADNRVAAEAEWDEDLLALELGELNDGGYDLGITGFNPAELDKLLREGGDVEGEDEVPEKPEEPISKPGDLWLLDDHRVICGDATDAAAVGTLINGSKADLIFTDPPYNVNYHQGGPYGSARKQSNKGRSIQNDNMSDAEFEQLLIAAFSNWLTVSKPGVAAYVCCSDKAMPEFRRAFAEAGFKWSTNILESDPISLDTELA